MGPQARRLARPLDAPGPPGVHLATAWTHLDPRLPRPPCYDFRPVTLRISLVPFGARFAVALMGWSAVSCSSESPWEQRPLPSTASPSLADADPSAPAHGFGDAIAWRPLDFALAQARREERPIMLVVHASWCRSCRALKPAFAAPDLTTLSRDLIMVNVDQDEEPTAREYAVDGSYIPRVLFLDPTTGHPIEDLYNAERPRNRYYYSPHDDLVGSMKKAIARYAKPS